MLSLLVKKSHSDESNLSKFATLSGYADSLQHSTAYELNAAQAKDMLATNDVTLIDTREPYEHGANNIPQLFSIKPARVMNIPLSRMANALVDGQLNPRGKYILLCRSGNRSKQAATNLSQLGFTDVYNLSGGMALL